MEYLFLIVVLILSIMIHEIAHGAVANYLGDPTAKYAGRLTLNPLKHIDPIGSIILPLFLIIMGSSFLIGWAKPVPVNPYNLRDKKWGSVKVSLAGPAVNFAIAVIFGLLLRFFPALIVSLNLFPMFAYIVFINLLLAVFNLLPIPPLDGSHILFGFLPPSMQGIKTFLNQFGIVLLLFVVFFLFPGVIYLINWIFILITNCSLYYFL